MSAELNTENHADPSILTPAADAAPCDNLKAAIESKINKNGANKRRAQDVDLSGLGADELRDLHRIVSIEIQKHQEAQVAELMDAFATIAKSRGIDASRLLRKKPLASAAVSLRRYTQSGAGASGRKPLYANPEAQHETWTGRGRKPRWLLALEKAGGEPIRIG